MNFQLVSRKGREGLESEESHRGHNHLITWAMCMYGCVCMGIEICCCTHLLLLKKTSVIVVIVTNSTAVPFKTLAMS